MSEIKLIVVGKIKEEYYREKIDQLFMDVGKRCKIQIVELEDESIPKNAGVSIMESVKEKEGKKILENIANSDFVIALCIDGRMTTREELKKIITDRKKESQGKLVFVIGGSLGLWCAVEKRANYKLSFSKMTFPHQLMRVMLMEQIMQCVKE